MASENSCSRFFEVPVAPPIRVFNLMQQCGVDTSPNKVDLTIGAYRTEEGKPWVLPVVREVEQRMAADETLDKEYLLQDGMAALREAAVRLVLGSGSRALVQNRAQLLVGELPGLPLPYRHTHWTHLLLQCFGFHTPSGTGALYLALDFLAKHNLSKRVYLSKPTWGNHSLLCKKASLEIHEYRYYDPLTKGLDFDGLIEDLRGAKEHSVVVLQMCAHNPTGVDPTHEQWGQIADVVQERHLFPLFDAAYQGFATGDLEGDTFAVRLFVSRGLELFVAQSFSKNFALYSERVGNLTVVLSQPEACQPVRSQMVYLVRALWSNPPSHGARVVATILNNPALHADWEVCLEVMSNRLRSVRQMLHDKLKQHGCPGDWSHILKQIGMFSYTGITPQQSEYMIRKHHIYTLDGRINVCGITEQNVDYVAKAMLDTVVNFAPGQNNS